MSKQIIDKTHQPGERLGMLFIAAALLLWIAMALHWNINEHGFIYRNTETLIEKAPKPTEQVNNAFWQEDELGWGLYDNTCVATDRAAKTDSNLLTYVPPLFCRNKLVPHTQTVRYTWHSTIKRYLSESFRSWGRYFWYNTSALLMFLLGILLYSSLFKRKTSANKSDNS